VAHLTHRYWSPATRFTPLIFAMTYPEVISSRLSRTIENGGTSVRWVRRIPSLHLSSASEQPNAPTNQPQAEDPAENLSARQDLFGQHNDSEHCHPWQIHDPEHEQ